MNPSIRTFIAAIERLPPKGRQDIQAGWIRWLQEYNRPGRYKRKNTNLDAKSAYNNLAKPFMLLWLIEAAGLSKATVVLAATKAALDVARRGPRTQAGAVRRQVPWAVIEQALWSATPSKVL